MGLLFFLPISYLPYMRKNKIPTTTNVVMVIPIVLDNLDKEGFSFDIIHIKIANNKRYSIIFIMSHIVASNFLIHCIANSPTYYNIFHHYI